KRGVDQDQEVRLFRLNRFDKFQTVADAQPKCRHQQMRLAFADLAPRVRYTVRFAADNHVWLRIDVNADPVAKHRVLVQDQDSRLWGVHIGICPRTVSNMHRYSDSPKSIFNS